MELTRLKGQNKNEIAMIEVAYEILLETNQVHDFNSLLESIQNYLELPTEELEQRMVNFYTQLNADGRFISLGENRWGLRLWYPVGAINEEIISTFDDDELKAKHKYRGKNIIKEQEDDDDEEDVIDYNNDDPEDDGIVEDSYGDGDEEDEDDPELRDYKADLNALGEEEDEELEDGLEGDLRLVDEDDELDDQDDDDED